MEQFRVSDLVQKDRIHRRVYTDPAIFELEMERLFGRTWLYVGHDSQVRKPGDFFCTRLGRNPVVLVQPVPRVDSYRGFVFASLAAEGPSLSEFLGHMSTSFDDLVDRAPEGEIQVAGGIARHVYRGNWKLIFENVNDGLHPLSVHQSSIEAARVQDDTVWSDGTGEIGIRQMRQNGAPLEFWDKQVGLWAYPHGHSYLGDYHDDGKLAQRCTRKDVP